MVQHTFWRPGTQPIATTKLIGNKLRGGLGLCDVCQASVKIFGQTMSMVLSTHAMEPHWTNTFRTQWAEALGLNPAHKQHNLNNWLSRVTTKRGPQEMVAFWKVMLSKPQAQPASKVPTKRVCDQQSDYPVTQSQTRKSTQITKSINMNR
ncbi:hypothetical protein DSO57_1008527 [Entomophthora muscae]|uniref:Uncharacterized protein n=1 Tax=Entomophthora muscae TaxID=34485 RepID=A0ACC2UGL7_9FUNG|nr:hypothetical protein DSO57_1008527 [Entomophthora muscae]